MCSCWSHMSHLQVVSQPPKGKFHIFLWLLWMHSDDQNNSAIWWWPGPLFTGMWREQAVSFLYIQYTAPSAAVTTSSDCSLCQFSTLTLAMFSWFRDLFSTWMDSNHYLQLTMITRSWQSIGNIARILVIMGCATRARSCKYSIFSLRMTNFWH